VHTFVRSLPQGRNILIAMYLCAIFVFAQYVIPNADIGYVLKTGEYVLEHRSIPQTDIYSFSAPGSSWIAHYWLAGVVFYVVFKVLGPLGLIFAVAVIAALAYLFAIKKLALASAESTPPLLIVLFPVSFLTLPMWNIRAQIFSSLFLAILLYLLEKWRIGKSRSSLYLIPLLILLWANMHAGVALGLAMLGLWSATAFVDEGFKLGRIRAQLIVLLSAVAAALVNPYGYKIILYQSNVDLNQEDFKSILSLLDRPADRNMFMVMLVVGCFLAVRKFANFRRGEKNLFELGLILTAIGLPLFSARHAVLFPLIVLPAFAKELESFLERFSFYNKGRPSLYVSAALLPIVLIAFRLPTVLSQPDPMHRVFPYALDAARFIQKENIPGPMFNLIENGGDLIWGLWPGGKVYIDGRNEVYHDNVYDEYYEILYRRDRWRYLVERKYEFNVFVFYYRGPQFLEGAISYLIDDLEANSEFRLIYWDEASLILVRDIPQNHDLIEKYAYSVLRPFSDPQEISPQDVPQALKEVDRALQISPDSLVLQNLRRSLLAHR
jgi:hypothetical protein